jgi:hypothetical protein
MGKADAPGLESAGKDLGQEALLCDPAGLGLWLAVAPGIVSLSQPCGASA